MTDLTSGTPPRRNRWELNPNAFNRLLQAFHANREEAGRRYETLRRKLLDLFSWEGSEEPEPLADETFNRLAKRLEEGAQLEGAALDRYAFGIARHLLQEEVRSRGLRQTGLREWRRLNRFEMPKDAGAGHDLEHCLEALPASSRELIQRYYNEDRGRLARSLGISVNALRNRALRIREQLYDCITRKRDAS